MRIGFYIHHTTIKAGGIFTYSIAILKLLLKAEDIHNIVIITSNEVNDKLKEILPHPKVEIQNIDRNDFVIKLRLYVYFAGLIVISIFKKIIPSTKLCYNFIAIANRINPYQKILATADVSVFHLPVQYSPIYKPNIPVIVTMHDLQEYHYPEFFSRLDKLKRRISNYFAIYFSDEVIVSFVHVKTDILKHFKINENKISVCSPPFTESWFVGSKETEWITLEKKYHLKKNYILYPAATWKHKNHITLIRVMKNLKNEGIEIDLVCTGNKTDYYKNIESLIDELRLSNTIYFLGIVPEEDLIGLYKNTSLVVIPTLYEAGSGPLYEAMRYQVPVICSNVTSLPETISNNDFVFSPTNMELIIEKIKLGLFDEDYRKRNIQNSKIRMQELSKLDYYQSFLTTYRKLIS
jgi:glycosyltransferase involved in cell wall biosynthesis